MKAQVPRVKGSFAVSQRNSVPEMEGLSIEWAMRVERRYPVSRVRHVSVDAWSENVRSRNRNRRERRIRVILASIKGGPLYILEHWNDFRHASILVFLSFACVFLLLACTGQFV